MGTVMSKVRRQQKCGRDSGVHEKNKLLLFGADWTSKQIICVVLHEVSQGQYFFNTM